MFYWSGAMLWHHQRVSHSKRPVVDDGTDPGFSPGSCIPERQVPRVETTPERGGGVSFFPTWIAKLVNITTITRLFGVMSHFCIYNYIVRWGNKPTLEQFVDLVSFKKWSEPVSFFWDFYVIQLSLQSRAQFVDLILKKWSEPLSFWRCLCDQLLGKRLTERRLLFQPSLVHFGWVFPVLCASASFFDLSKSCGQLLYFVNIYVSDFHVVVFSSFEDLGQIFIYIFRCRGLRPQSVQPLLYQHIDSWVKKWSDWKKWRVEATGRSEESSLKSVLEVTGRSEERSIKSYLEVTGRSADRA